jgi:hypothetical protein
VEPYLKRGLRACQEKNAGSARVVLLSWIKKFDS